MARPKKKFLKCITCQKRKKRDSFRNWKFHNLVRKRSVCITCQLKKDKIRGKGGYYKNYYKEYKSNPENAIKISARYQFHKALRLGEIKRNSTCEMCGSSKNVEGHHPDYSKPLEVVWLCKVHHYQADKE